MHHGIPWITMVYCAMVHHGIPLFDHYVLQHSRLP